MEDRVAQKLGGFRTIASGAIFGDMDVDKDSLGGDQVGFKIDCKLTDAKSHALNIEKFRQVRDAASLGQIPAYFIEFRQYEETLFVTDEQNLFYLLQTIENREEEWERLREDLADWYEMSNGGFTDDDNEHLKNLMDTHNIPRRLP